MYTYIFNNHIYMCTYMFNNHSTRAGHDTSFIF